MSTEAAIKMSELPSKLPESKIENAEEELIQVYNYDIITKYFKYHSTRDKSEMLKQNKILNKFLKKELMTSENSIIDLLFNDNEIYSLDNEAWYKTMGHLLNINEWLTMLDMDGEYSPPISELNNALHRINPKINLSDLYNYKNQDRNPITNVLRYYEAGGIWNQSSSDDEDYTEKWFNERHTPDKLSYYKEGSAFEKECAEFDILISDIVVENVDKKLQKIILKTVGKTE